MNTHRIRRLAAVATLTAALTVAAAVPAEAKPGTPTHTSTEIQNICRVIEQSTWPNWNTNLVGVYKTASLHFYGLHYAQCCFYDLRNGQKIYALYLIGYGDLTFPQNDPWCR